MWSIKDYLERYSAGEADHSQALVAHAARFRFRLTHTQRASVSASLPIQSGELYCRLHVILGSFS